MPCPTLADEAGSAMGRLEKQVSELQKRLAETREECTALRQQLWKRKAHKGVPQTIEGSLGNAHHSFN